jgi:hypothetical protein
MTTIEHRPPEHSAPRPVTRDDAMKFYAAGRTSAGLRAHAADPAVLEGMAAMAGVSQEVMREQALALADAIDAIDAEGITQEQAYFLMRLDKHFGPFPGTLSTAGRQS